MKLDEILSLIRDLMTAAGKIILEAKRNDGDTGSEEKVGTANFVTKYDVAVQSFLIEGLRAAIPDAVFLAEEKNNSDDYKNAEHSFIIDPIDGTTNFIQDFHRSCISVAYLSYGVSKIGAVYDPYLDELFYATEGGGAYLNGKPLHIGRRERDHALVLFGTSPYYKATFTDASFACAKEFFMTHADIRRSGTAALDLAYLAAGRCDVFFEYYLSPWDFAAGELIVREAGGVITDVDKNPLTPFAPSNVIGAAEQLYDYAASIAKKHYPIQ